jgi:hypothetical protein
LACAHVGHGTDLQTLELTGPAGFPGGVGKTWEPGGFEELLDDVSSRVFEVYGDDDTSVGAGRPNLGRVARAGLVEAIGHPAFQESHAGRLKLRWSESIHIDSSPDAVLEAMLDQHKVIEWSASRKADYRFEPD